jgi:hypothetical protein
MFEHRTEPLLSQAVFRRRLARHGLYALALVSGSLVAGTLGFWYLGGQPLVDAYLNSAMLLGGMGPVGEIRFTSGKLFAAFFALYAGLVFIGVSTILGAWRVAPPPERPVWRRARPSCLRPADRRRWPRCVRNRRG